MNHKETRTTLWTNTLMGGIVLLIASLALITAMDRPLRDAQTLTMVADEGTLLAATYIPGELDAGVMLLEGFGSDQVALRSAAREFARAGFHVFTFDFSGHGRSSGTLGYDNAQTPRLAHQALEAMAVFQDLSGLSADRVLWLGHSLGARVALQAAVLDPLPAGLVLIGAQINLGTNLQSEFFTGVRDAELDWVQRLDSDQPPVPILLATGAWDDVLSPAAADMLLEALGGEGSSPSRELVVFPSLLHNHEVVSPRVLSQSLIWAGERLDLTLPASDAAASFRIYAWIAGYVGFMLALLASGQLLSSLQETDHNDNHIALRSASRFLWGKALLLVPGLLVGVLMGGLFFFLPIGLPTYNLLYVVILGGLGVLLLVLYRAGKVPGITGKLLPCRQGGGAISGILQALLLTAGSLFITAWYARTGWFHVYPLNARLLWLPLFSIPTAVGFWVALKEGALLRAQPELGVGTDITARLIALIPFLLYAVALAAIGSPSGVVGVIQGLLILAVVMAFGGLLRRVTRVDGVIAASQALLLYWLILPQAALFG